MRKFIKWRIVGAAAICLGFLAIASLPNVCGAQTSSASAPSCFDGDGGVDIYKKGRMSYQNDPKLGTGADEDYCAKEPSAGVYEYSCSNSGTVVKSTIDCPNGCKDGACVLDSKAGQKIGDADGDGKITKADSTIISQIDADLIGMPSNICAMDLDKNSKVDDLDALFIEEILLGKKKSPGVCLPDLTIDEITLSPSNPVPNKEVKILVKGKNIGNTPIVFIKGGSNPLYMKVVFPGFTQKSFLISPDIQKDYTIAPQGIFSYTFTGYFKTGGAKNLTATIDGFAVLKESNKKNNTFKKKIETAFLCADSDGGEDFYKKGVTKGYDNYGGNIGKVATYTDKCGEAQDTSVSVKKVISYAEEFYCETQNDPTDGAGYVAKTSNDCLIGCNDGACIKNGNGMIDVDLNKTLLTQKELGKKFILMDLATTTPSVSSSEDAWVDIGVEAIGTSTQKATEPKQKIRQVYTSVDYEKNEQIYEFGMVLFNSVGEAQTEYKNDDRAKVALNKWEKFGDDTYCIVPEKLEAVSGNKVYRIVCGFRLKNTLASMVFTNILDIKYSVALSALKQYYNKLVKEMGKEQKTSKVKGESVEKPYAKYLSNLAGDIQNLSGDTQERLKNFILDGANADTKLLGEGERTAVVFSYKDAYGKLPETEEEFSDLEKIANGRWPSAKSQDAEERARQQFGKIFQREADADNVNDDAAVVVMAYGLRQQAENRNVSKEKNASDIFKSIYGYNPQETADWNIVQAIAYSGAVK